MTEIKNDQIRNILYTISNEVILPKFKKLRDNDIKFKQNGSLVTSVDIEVEDRLNKDLLKLIPNSLFVGEESYTENNKITRKYQENNFCWTVDPIDGTRNFAKGKEKFAIMIALTFKEKIIQSWIYRPLTEELAYARLGDGAFINDMKIINKNDCSMKDAVGSISTKYWNKNISKKINNIKSQFTNINSYGCIGLEYVDTIKGLRNFIILSKLLPWDHLPGILLIKESGGYIRHFDKSLYSHISNNENLVVTNSINLLNDILNVIEG